MRKLEEAYRLIVNHEGDIRSLFDHEKLSPTALCSFFSHDYFQTLSLNRYEDLSKEHARLSSSLSVRSKMSFLDSLSSKEDNQYAFTCPRSMIDMTIFFHVMKEISKKNKGEGIFYTNLLEVFQSVDIISFYINAFSPSASILRDLGEAYQYPGISKLFSKSFTSKLLASLKDIHCIYKDAVAKMIDSCVPPSDVEVVFHIFGESTDPSFIHSLASEHLRSHGCALLKDKHVLIKHGRSNNLQCMASYGIFCANKTLAEIATPFDVEEFKDLIFRYLSAHSSRVLMDSDPIDEDDLINAYCAILRMMIEGKEKQAAPVKKKYVKKVKKKKVKKKKEEELIDKDPVVKSMPVEKKSEKKSEKSLSDDFFNKTFPPKKTTYDVNESALKDLCASKGVTY